MESLDSNDFLVFQVGGQLPCRHAPRSGVPSLSLRTRTCALSNITTITVDMLFWHAPSAMSWTRDMASLAKRRDSGTGLCRPANVSLFFISSVSAYLRRILGKDRERQKISWKGCILLKTRNRYSVDLTRSVRLKMAFKRDGPCIGLSLVSMVLF